MTGDKVQSGDYGTPRMARGDHTRSVIRADIERRAALRAKGGPISPQLRIESDERELFVPTSQEQEG